MKAALNRIFFSFLKGVERVGNALPHPAFLFLLLCGIVVLISFLAAQFGLEAIHPKTKQVLLPVNLLSVEGLHYLLTEMVKNFTGFAPLGTVLVAMIGFSFAEKSGLLGALLRLIVIKSPKALVIPAILLAGVLSHTAGDIGYVLLIPLSAMAAYQVGLHPLAGLAASFAGVSGGFAANFLLSTADPLLSGISQEAARIIDADYKVSPLANWYFMASSSILIVLIGTLVTNKIVIPFLGKFSGAAPESEGLALKEEEKKGLRVAGLVLAVLVGFILWGCVPEDGFLRDPKTGNLLTSPILKGIVPVVFLIGTLTGLAYGFVAKSFRTQDDLVRAMQDAMVTMAPYLVLVFFASQFIALFNYSNVGVIAAIHGADYLETVGLGSVSLMIGFILLTVVMDLMIGSASAKWALMAPIFIPMFMLLGYAPELTQSAYRIGDSVVNIISPLMSYFPLILAFAAKYDSQARVGTLVALMLPYSLSFLLFWSCFLFLWMTMEWPLGPGAELWYRLP
jgi:aminobenzoyl-glutamate transport protein